MSKRYRELKARPGELKAGWSKPRHERDQITYAWGEDVSHYHSHLLHAMLGNHSVLPQDTTYLEEFATRGFDLKTLKFSIRMKKKKEERRRLMKFVNMRLVANIAFIVSTVGEMVARAVLGLMALHGLPPAPPVELAWLLLFYISLNADRVPIHITREVKSYLERRTVRR